MPKNVQMPDGKVIEFPDGMSDDDISGVLRQQSAPPVAGAPVGGLPQPDNFSQSPAATSVLQPPAASTATTNLLKTGEAYKGILKSIPGSVSGASKAVNSIPAVGPLLSGSAMDPQGYQAATDKLDQAATTNGSFEQNYGKGVGNAAQFLIPGGAEEKLGLYGASKLPAAFAPLAKMGASALTTGAVNKAQGGDFGTGALTGAVGSGAGQMLKAWAPQVAESALKVLGNDRMYGRTVGQAVLDDTQGIKPAAVMQSAKDKISELTPQLTQLSADATQAGSRGSLAPARTGVQNTINSLTTNRAVNTAKDIQPLQSFLDRDAVTGLPLSASQTPTGLRQLKQGLDADFIGNWNPNNNTKGQLSAARAAYGNLASEFHTAAPGAADIDQRISSLIPVADRADRISRGAPTTQQLFNKFAAPTGALAAPIAGGLYGKEHGGTEGAIGGAMAGALLPALLATPTGQMALARGLYSKALPNVITPLIKGSGLVGARSLFGNAKPQNQ